MNYLIVCCTQGVYYLLLTKDDNNNFNIRAFDSKDAVMESFGGYKDKWLLSSTWQASACLGMMQMQPVAIKAPDTVDPLVPYIIEQKVVRISGGVIGMGYYGMPVKESIIELKEFDIWNQSMKEGGLID